MNYVKSFNLFGVDAAQIPCIPGHGAPTTTTEGAVGCFYMDEDTGAVYKCVSANGGAYVWSILVPKADQNPCILGHGTPTIATEGAVGYLYMDEDTGELYKCVSVTDGVYIWEAVVSSDEDVGDDSVITAKLSDYSPAAGQVSITSGVFLSPEQYGYGRVVNGDLIPVTAGDKITASNGYAFNIFKFDSSGNYTKEHGTYGYTEYTVDWDGFLRLGIGLTHTINLANYSPGVGTVGLGVGVFRPQEESGYTNRVANGDLIPVKVGDKITSSNGYAFNIFKFDADGNFTSNGTYGYTEYTVDWDGFLRLAIGSEHSDMNGYVSDVCENVRISRVIDNMTDYIETACDSIRIIAELNVYAEITALKQGQVENKRIKYLFNFPYNLNHLYVSDHTEIEDITLDFDPIIKNGNTIKTMTPAAFHAKMKELCDMAPGYATQTLLGNDADGNPLYKYVLEPNVPYVNCSRQDSLIVDRPIDGVKIDTPTIIILSGIHGIEASNDYAVYNFIKDLLTNRNEALDFIFRNLRLVIVPAICASGELAYTYGNSDGVNINRDFPLTQDGTTQSLEAGYIKDVIDTYNDAIVLIDMHTHQAKDIMSWNYTDDEIFKYVATRIGSDLAHAWIDKYPDVNFDTAHETYNPFTKVWVYQAPNIENTSSTYASRVWGIPAGTIEMRRSQPITGIYHDTDAVAFSYDILVNFIISFCRTIA